MPKRTVEAHRSRYFIYDKKILTGLVMIICRFRAKNENNRCVETLLKTNLLKRGHSEQQILAALMSSSCN